MPGGDPDLDQAVHAHPSRVACLARAHVLGHQRAGGNGQHAGGPGAGRAGGLRAVAQPAARGRSRARLVHSVPRRNRVSRREPAVVAITDKIQKKAEKPKGPKNKDAGKGGFTIGEPSPKRYSKDDQATPAL